MRNLGKQVLGAILLCVGVSAAIPAWATVLPDSCGSDGTTFNVKTQKNRPAPAPPAAGKAQFVFIEALDKDLACWSCGTPTSRFGMDGAWVGANKGSSYFTVDVSPGEHHLCADWQSAFGSLKDKLGMADVNAEAGKTYYFEAKVTLHVHQYGTGANSSSEVDQGFHFKQADDDEGQYRIKASAVATWTEKK